jgi:hypothetical protein
MSNYDPSAFFQYYNYRHLNTLDGRWVNRDPAESDGNPLLCCGNNTLNHIDVKGLWRDVSDEEKKLKVYVYCCPKDCKLKVANPQLDLKSTPTECVIEHEESHIADLPAGTGCYSEKKDGKKCCKNAGQSPDENDYGGKEKLYESECKAFKKTASCCARLVGIGVVLDPSKPPKKNTKEDKNKARICIITSKYRSSLKYGQVDNEYKKTCPDVAFYDDLLKKVDEL